TVTSGLSLHDALPICGTSGVGAGTADGGSRGRDRSGGANNPPSCAQTILTQPITANSSSTPCRPWHIKLPCGCQILPMSPPSLRSEEHTSELQSRENL